MKIRYSKRLSYQIFCLLYPISGISSSVITRVYLLLLEVIQIVQILSSFISITICTSDAITVLISVLTVAIDKKNDTIIKTCYQPRYTHTVWDGRKF